MDSTNERTIHQPAQLLTLLLPIIIHKTKLRYCDVGSRGSRNQHNRFTQRVLAYAHKLSENERYILRKTHAEKRHIQETLLYFIESNGGRVIQKVPGTDMYYYVVSRRAALSIMAAKLREGPDLSTIDDTSINSFDVDVNDLDISIDDAIGMEMFVL